MKMSMNNGELGCDLYFDDPDFPRNLHIWLESLDDTKQRCTRGYKRYKETSGLIERKECQIFHSIFT